MKDASSTFLRRIKRRKFGELLLSHGSITPEQLQEALELQQRDGGLLGEILIAKGHISENEVVRSLSTQYALPVLRISDYDVDQELVNKFPPELLYTHTFLPLSRLEDLLLVTCADLPEDDAIAEIEATGQGEPIFYLSALNDILDSLMKFVTVSAETREELILLRHHRRGGQRASGTEPPKPAASERPAPAPRTAPSVSKTAPPAPRTAPPGAAASKPPEAPAKAAPAAGGVFSDLDNAWESIFDEAEQNLKEDGM